MIRFIIICVITLVIPNIQVNGRLFPEFNKNNFLQFFQNEGAENDNSVNFDNEHSVCRSKECFRVAAELWESVNKSVDPCEDFYEYACGKWTINNPIPPNKASWNSISKTELKVEKRLRDLFEEKINKDDTLPVKQLKKFYRSCMNIEALESVGIRRLQAILANNGGWPMAMELAEWDSEEFPWQQIDKNYLKLTGSSAFYNLDITEDYREISLDYFFDSGPKKSVKMLLEISSPNLPAIMPAKKNVNRTMLYESGEYAKLITEVALTFAKERDTTINKDQLETDVQDIINLEMALDEGIDNMQYDSSHMSLAEWQKKYDEVSKSKTSKFNWISVIIDYFADANVEIDENEEINVNFYYLKFIIKILNKTKPRTIVNYIHWYFLKQFLSYTTQHMRNLEFNLYKKMTGVEEETPRSEVCVEAVGMEHAKAYLFVKKYFTDDMKEHAKEMFLAIQKEMAKHILRADWLDDEMRKSVLLKINKMKTNIGYPDWYNNATAMEHFYRGMTIGNQFLENVFSSTKFNKKRELRTLRNKVREDDWDYGDALMVNAFYEVHINTLSIPAGEFQTSFYSPTIPEIMSYGSIGFTVGHEISHGFDVDGIKSDHDGKNIKYSYDMKSEYKERANCFIDQFEEFYKDKPKDKKSKPLLQTIWDYFTKKTEWTENAERTQAENMADSLGLEIVFDALKDIENEKNSPRFPGFEDLSNEQFFFVTYANVWCYSSRSKYDDFLMNYDPHSEERYRVIAAVQNSQEFAKAFNCPEGSYMNPEKKCKIW